MSEMTDNVIVLGAGFSHDAGIPLLRDFVDTLWTIRARGGYGDTKLKADQKEVFEAAIHEIQETLEPYHARANFDERNIEDVLSILSIVMQGSRKKSVTNITQAISEAIEITCTLPQQSTSRYDRSEPALYRELWSTLFDWYKKYNTIPTIISFNYDLVLERALCQALMGPWESTPPQGLPFQTLNIDYEYSDAPRFVYRVERARFQAKRPPHTDNGTTLAPISDEERHQSHLTIELLKPHGSVNFGAVRKTEQEEAKPIRATVPAEKPLIVPPVTNKGSNPRTTKVWSTALKRIAHAKNLIFVGYSLPSTDQHVQYFLRAAVGRARDLDKVFVFDPALFRDDETSKAIRRRYEDCFAEQFRKRIETQPPRFNAHVALDEIETIPVSNQLRMNGNGTVEHFLEILRLKPEAILAQPHL